MFRRVLFSFVVLAGCLAGQASTRAEIFRIGTYNLENYIESPSGNRPAKSDEAKAKIRESIQALRANVLALEEIGDTNALLELRSSLKAEGLDYPYWEHVSGSDTNIFVAILSQFPIVARRPHTHESFLLRGRRFQVGRGFAEVDIQVNPGYTFTLFAAHLKSKRQSGQADESEIREQEAILFREKIDAFMDTHPDANVVAVGDFNDVKDSYSTRAVIGRGKKALIDTRPSEKNGDVLPSHTSRLAPRNIAWTHFFGKEDTYSRIDYILLNRGMAKEWIQEESFVLALPNWGVASDHRPIVAAFASEER